MVRDLGLRNYHAADARETQRRNRLLRLSLLDGLRLEDDEPPIILPEGSQRLLAFLGACGFRIDKMLFMRPGALQR